MAITSSVLAALGTSMAIGAGVGAVTNTVTSLIGGKGFGESLLEGLKGAGIGAGTGLITAGLGSAAGAAGGAIAKAAEGGSKIAQGAVKAGEAVTNVTSKIGSVTSSIGDKVGNVVGNIGDKTGIGNAVTKVGEVAGKVATKVGIKGNVTGGAAEVAKETATDTATAGVANNVTSVPGMNIDMSKLPTPGSAENVGIGGTREAFIKSATNKGTQITGNTMSADITKQAAITSPATKKGVITSAQSKQQAVQGGNVSATPTTASGTASTGSKIDWKETALSAGVNIASTGISAAIGAKSSKDANKIAREGLELQRSMYEEQKAERDLAEAEKKSSATKARQMGLLFGESLYNSSSNSQTLSGSSSGNFSLLNIKRQLT